MDGGRPIIEYNGCGRAYRFLVPGGGEGGEGGVEAAPPLGCVLGRSEGGGREVVKAVVYGCHSRVLRSDC